MSSGSVLDAGVLPPVMAFCSVTTVFAVCVDSDDVCADSTHASSIAHSSSIVHCCSSVNVRSWGSMCTAQCMQCTRYLPSVDSHTHSMLNVSCCKCQCIHQIEIDQPRTRDSNATIHSECALDPLPHCRATPRSPLASYNATVNV